MNTRFLKALAAAFVVVGGSLHLLAEPQPLWRVDLLQYGGKLGACSHPVTRQGKKIANTPNTTDHPVATVRFWSHYLVVDMAPRPVWVYDKNQGKEVIANDVTPCPRLVFDLNTHELAPEEVVASADWEKPPTTLLQTLGPVSHLQSREITSHHRVYYTPPFQDQPRDAVHVLAQWKDMAVVSVGSGVDLYLQEPGKQLSPLYRVHDDGIHPSNCLPAPMFLGVDRIGIDKCSTFLDRYDEPMLVVDKTGRKQYTRGAGFSGARPSVGSMALNRTGTRYALYGPGSNLARVIRNSFFSRNSLNWIGVEVYDSDNGHKLFQYHWSGENDDYLGDEGRAALSDDGSLLAVLKESEVLVFSVPEKAD